MTLITVARELKAHAPFTALGALTGVAVMVVFYRLPADISYNIFYILHPSHVFLSALVTASMYGIHKYGKLRHSRDLLSFLLIGYFGSVGIATISDSIIPFAGEVLLDLPNRGLHLGFIEKWWLVNPLAVAGIAFAYFWPSTKMPHFAHVLISTWASLFHVLMALGGKLNVTVLIVAVFFLFLAVWIPCCVSDIVFPLLFLGKKRTERLFDKSTITFDEKEVLENRKRLEERNLLHLRYGMDRSAAYRFIIDRLEPAEGTLLEIGTGRGITASLLAKEFRSVTTVDISDSDIKTALLNAAYEKVLDRTSYCICDAAKLPFRDNEFEHSISINGFHHFKNPLSVISEMIRVTKKRIVVADFSESGFKIVRKEHELEGKTHEEYESSAESIGKVFEHLGYKAERAEGFHHLVFTVNKKGR